ncbi:MAG: methyl-accepting chemotaxis protein [Devosia sp.]
MRLIPKLNVAQKLPLVLIGSALVVGLGIGIAAYSVGLQTLDEQRQQRMDASAQAGLAQVKTYFDNVAGDLKLFSARADTATQIENMAKAFGQLNIQGHGTQMLQDGYITNNPNQADLMELVSAGPTVGEYDGQHRRFHPGWRALALERDYQDIMLFGLDGTMIYSARKNLDFATSFAIGSGNPLSEGDLGKLLRHAAELPVGSVAYTDFAFYGPTPGVPESFMATPVYKGEKFMGVMAFELSSKPISASIGGIGGLGQTGEVMIVGADGLMRTQSRYESNPNVLVTPVEADFVADAIAGTESSGVIGAFRDQRIAGLALPYELDGTHWAIVAMQTEAENMAPVIGMRNTMLAVGAVLLAIAAGLGLLFARSITKPITRLTGTMKALAEGNLDVEVTGTQRIDEVGEMARTVEVFRDNALRMNSMTDEERAASERRRIERTDMMQALQQSFGAVVDAAQQGDFTGRVEAEFSDRELNVIAASINNLVGTVDRGIAETAKVLSALAQTDLTHRVEGDYQGAFLGLKTDTNAVAETLSKIVRQLRTTSRNLKTATGEILSGANDLSERTTKQAATIEETSAAMEQLANTVLENAQRAKDASVVAASVTRTAEEGGVVMSKATDAMERITVSSGKISNIIGLIDDVAFQTNLLALNASVEAARAGEAGKGFAVVAVEVRRLAQSAAQASSEVKGLVQQSGTEVLMGSKLVVEAASKLEAMLTAARSSNELMNGIAKQSQDQARSIEEVNAAVRTMDEMTQHNAALVEQTNAAIEQTEAQAIELDRIVEVFRLDGGAESTAPARGARGLQDKVKAAAQTYLRRGAA